MPDAPDAPLEIVLIPRVYLQLGDPVSGRYPIYYCAAGDNSGAVKIGTATKAGYEVICAAADAYNDARNAEMQQKADA